MRKKELKKKLAEVQHFYDKSIKTNQTMSDREGEKHIKLLRAQEDLRELRTRFMKVVFDAPDHRLIVSAETEERDDVTLILQRTEFQDGGVVYELINRTERI